MSALGRCAKCGSNALAAGGKTSVTAGTIFQDTRKPLRLWFRAMWTITTQKNGASALGLQRVSGTGQLPNRLDLDAQAEASDGAPGAGAIDGPRRCR